MWFKDKKIIRVLAPMADYTDQPFCRIIREIAGNDFVIFREMVSSEAIVRNNKKTLKMCEFDKIERPIVLQIFGSNPEIMSKAVSIMQTKFKPDGIDLNMGCPVPKITQKNEAGASLMKNPNKAVKIIKKIKQDNPTVVLSVKIRLGWSDKTDILEFASKLEKAGVQLLTIHGRTKMQGYSGKADWEMIGKVKKILKIPVIANGDIKNRNDIDKCLQTTKADGVMIGRGALGNPWVFRQFLIFNFQSLILVETVLRHAKYHLEHYGENSIRTFRKHLLWYFKSNLSAIIQLDYFNCYSGAMTIKEFRNQLVKVDSLVELEKILKIL